MIISGIGGGTYHPVGIPLIGKIFEEKERGRALGVHGFAASAGFFLTPVILGFLYQFGWRFSFLIFAIFGFLIAGIGWIITPRQLKDEFRQDVRNKKTSEKTNIHNQINKYVIYATVTRSIFAFGNSGVTIFIPAFLKTIYGFSDQIASFIYSIMFAGGLISSLIGGYMSDKIGRENVLLIVLTMMSIGALVLWMQVPIYILIIAISTFGAASSAFVPVADALLVDLLPEYSRGKGFGLFYTSGFIAQAISPTISGFFVDTFSFNIVYLIMGITIAVGIPFIILIRKRLIIN
jgi:MFS family permease